MPLLEPLNCLERKNVSRWPRACGRRTPNLLVSLQSILQASSVSRTSNRCTRTVGRSIWRRLATKSVAHIYRERDADTVSPRFIGSLSRQVAQFRTPSHGWSAADLSRSRQSAASPRPQPRRKLPMTRPVSRLEAACEQLTVSERADYARRQPRLVT